MPFDESVILEVAKQLAVVQKTPVNQNLARQLLELAASNKSDIDLFGTLPQPPKPRHFLHQPTGEYLMRATGTMAKKLGTFPVTLLLAIHAKAMQSATATAPVKGFSKSSSDRMEGGDVLPVGGLSGGLQSGGLQERLLTPGAGGQFKPEFRASALGLDKMVQSACRRCCRTHEPVSPLHRRVRTRCS
jgi:hypothetical protein